jgi:hypothetical protein
VKLSELAKRFEGDDPELAIDNGDIIRPVLTACGHLGIDSNQYVVLFANDRKEVR